MTDARFHEAAGRPLKLWATDAEDLQIVSALCQDAVLPGSDIHYTRRDRRVALLLNRFRWENGVATPERVRSLLAVSDVSGVRGQGIVPGDSDTILSLLAIEWVPSGEEGDVSGVLRLTFAGDGLVELRCDCLDVTLSDVTRPHAAVAGRAPEHKP